ncbi:MAG: glycosyltransferase family 4 protein [Acidobacteria bacterium]|nr:glycosyltransferase family 4 protein [Acidobacteriota bacterium]
MRILLDYRPALRQRSGVGEYVHELAAALIRRLPAGDTLTLFSSSWKDRLRPDVVPGARVVDARVPVRTLNYAWHRLEWPAVDAFAGPIELAHAMHPLLIPARRAAGVITIHDLDFLDHPERTHAEIRRDYAALAASHAARADHVVTVSAFTAAEIARRLDVPRDRITIASPGAPAWAPRTGVPADAPILFMGTLEPRKNVGLLLRAYARLVALVPSAPRLLLAGGATPAAASWLREIAEPPLAGRVEHLGYVEPDRRRPLYASASMLVLPSHLEGFGLPVLEAMTMGVPVIVSRRGALPEVAGDAGVMIEPDDVEGLARAMQRYLDDPAAAAAAAERGRERARTYSWDASAVALLEAYRHAASRRRIVGP